MKAWVIVGAIGLAGCAHDSMPPLRGGAELAPHMNSVEPLIERSPTLRPWEPSVLYPALQSEEAAAPRAGSAIARGPLRATAWLWFRAYQSTFSRVDGSTCRFRPTCSGFGLDAVEHHGVFGLSMTFARLVRNHAGERFYPMSDPPFLDDPVANYGFTRRRPALDDFASYDDPAHAWYQHVRATRRLR